MKPCPICQKEIVLNAFLFQQYTICACESCGFRWLEPQPTDEELSKIYSERYFLDDGDAKVKQVVNALKRATASLYLEQISSHEVASLSGLSLLEIGCGMGDFLLEAHKKGCIVSGLEVTDSLVEFANNRLGKLSVQKGYLETATFENSSFDIIAFFDVIEHVRQPTDFMRRVNRLLRNNGKVYLVTPSLDSWSAKLLGRSWMEYKLEHLSYFTKRSMQVLLEGSGFHKIKFCSNYKMLSLDYINRHFIRFPIHGLTPIVNLVREITPSILVDFPVKVVASGMAVIAEKRDDV